MRAGGACTVQQTLTTEAASVLKHSLTLARRRGHAQVTPLHVAATLLSTRTSLLRRACLKSQQSHHPLHGRALELCFNVALNRLPTATAPSGPTPLSLPLLHGHSQPSLSNALIAALKRAQAHQRRGCIEQQNHQPQQPLSLTIKVELEQLILSILDDPSVSRVMREAGFSSTDIKNNLEEYSSSASSSTSLFYSNSGGVFSSPCSPKREIIINPSTNTYWQNSTHFLNHSFEQSPVFLSPQKIKTFPVCKSDDSDIKVVLDVLLKKRKNIVVVGDSISLTEGLVTDLMGKVEKGEVPEELKSVQFIKFQFASVSLRFMRKQDVEMNLSDLKRKVDFCLSSGGGRGVIIYLGDLRWAVETTNDRDSFFGYENLVDYLVGKMRKLLSGYNISSSKVWLMATSSYQTYMKCQMKQPPLEAQWGLHAISVPSGGFGLSLHGPTPSVHAPKTLSQVPSQMTESKPFSTKEEQNKLSCCGECSNNYEKEAAFLKSHQTKALPSWLQTRGADAHQQQDELGELRRKWNRLCSSLHHFKTTANYSSSYAYTDSQNSIGKNYNSSYPWWHTQKSINLESSTICLANSAHSPDHKSNHIPRFRRQHSCIEVFGYGVGKNGEVEARLESLKNSEGKEVKITLALGNCLLSDSEKIGGTMLDQGDLSRVLEENVPWESKTIPSMAEALIHFPARKNSWFLIEGEDFVGKRRLAMAVAEAIFGSTDMLFTMSMRKLGKCGIPCSEILEEALRKRKKLVALIEDVDLADTQFIKFVSEGYETGHFGRSFIEGQDGSSVQAIFILTRGSSNGDIIEADQSSVIQLQVVAKDTKISSPVTPNSISKRKGEWDFSHKAKNARVENEEKASNVDNVQGKKDFSRQSSLNTLDLNMKADEDEDNDSSSVEFSPVQGEQTCESSKSRSSPDGLLKLIENRFVFDQDPRQDRGFKEDFLSSKMKGCFQQVIGGEHMASFSVEHRVLEEMVVGSGYFLNSQYEKWVKNVFEKTMQGVVNNSGKGKGILEEVDVRVCLKEGKGDSNSGLGEGYIGTNLPQKIHVSYLD